MWLIIFLLAIVFLLGYIFYLREFSVFKKYGIPYTKPMPIFGSMFWTIFRLASIGELTEMAYNVDRKAKYIGMYDGSDPVILLRDPELIKTVIVKNFDSFPYHRSFVSEDLEPLFSKNVFVLKGDRWKEVRNILSPVFTTSKMRSMFKLMDECAVDYAKFFAQLPADERVTDMKDAFTRYANDVIGTCVFGLEINSMKDRHNIFYVYGREATNFNGFIKSIKFVLIRSYPTLCKMFNIKFVKQEISDFFLNLVKTTIKTRDEQGIVRPDLIQQLMETRSKDVELTLEDMTAQAFQFFFAGFDSTSTLMSFVTHELAVNPDIQEKLQQEIDEVIERTNGILTYEAMNGMKILDAVVNEGLRMYPMAVIADRVCTKEYELPATVPDAKPYVVKPGDYVWYPIYGLQRDPNYFSEPSKFKPERFIEDPNLVHSGAYVPFGLGPRMCIGNRFAMLEVKAVLFHLLARCNLVPCAKTTIPMKLSRKSLAMTAENGFWLSVEPRSKPHSLIAGSMQNGN